MTPQIAREWLLVIPVAVYVVLTVIKQIRAFRRNRL
jgi:hypothetical protein